MMRCGWRVLHEHVAGDLAPMLHGEMRYSTVRKSWSARFGGDLDTCGLTWQILWFRRRRA